MAFIEWKPAYSVQVEDLDRQHQRLVELINSLHDAMKIGAPRQALERIVSDLVAYTRFHFQTEERLMQFHGFPLLSEHLREHESLTTTVVRFQEDLHAGRVAVSIPLMQFLKSWLTGHILGSDVQYAPYMKGCEAA
ncbi:MAG TPA: bacteriohemerythrin [Bryobacteraceae bacterium]|nr:bacteriohemerythrin [Bryobacteraceae bacterium]